MKCAAWLVAVAAVAIAVCPAMAQVSTSSPKPTASPTPTPNPYRSLHFGAPTLGGTPPGNIAVFNGWVAVKRDGRGAHACISFKNEGSLTATRLLVDFLLMNHAGSQVATLTLDRRGTFSPSVEIHGWKDLQSWQSGTNRGYDENCIGLKQGMAAFPLLSARTATYRITRVEYANGTDWSPASP
jgi:hypothetical protein